MTTKINVAGVWKEPTPSINVAGVWKTPDNVKINVAGTWKEVFSNTPVVSVRADGRTNSRLDNSCYVGLAFYTTGLEYEYNSSGSITNSTTWLTSGNASNVWIMWTRTGGSQSDWDSLGVGYNNVRRQVTGTIAYRLVDTVSSAAGGAETITGYIRAYDAASGGNLLDTGPTATWSARRWHDTCPLCCFTPDRASGRSSGASQPTDGRPPVRGRHGHQGIDRPPLPREGCRPCFRVPRDRVQGSRATVEAGSWHGHPYRKWYIHPDRDQANRVPRPGLHLLQHPVLR